MTSYGARTTIAYPEPEADHGGPPYSISKSQCQESAFQTVCYGKRLSQRIDLFEYRRRMIKLDPGGRRPRAQALIEKDCAGPFLGPKFHSSPMAEVIPCIHNGWRRDVGQHLIQH